MSLEGSFPVISYILYVLIDIIFLHSPGNCQCLKWIFFCPFYFPLAKCLYHAGSDSKLCLTAGIKFAILTWTKYQNSFSLWASDSFRAYTWTIKVLFRLISYVEDADILSHILDNEAWTDQGHPATHGKCWDKNKANQEWCHYKEQKNRDISIKY